MATIRKRGSSWHVQTRRQGFPTFTKTISSKADAAAWARDKERSIDRGEQPSAHREPRCLTVLDLKWLRVG
jgi:hypothetical protein